MRFARLAGTLLHPVIELVFDQFAAGADGRSLTDWVRSLPDRTWDANKRAWVIRSFGPTPERDLAQAGFVVLGPDGEPADLSCYVRPVALVPVGADDNRVHVYPRLTGKSAVSGYLGPDAIWTDTHASVPGSRLLIDGKPVGWCEVPDAIVRGAVGRPGIAPMRHATTLPPLTYDGTIDGLRGVPLVDLSCVGGKTANAMYEVGVHNVFDLLHQVPRRYIDLSNPVPAASGVIGETVAVVGTVTKVKPAQLKGDMATATVRDDAGTNVYVRWFNAGWAARQAVVNARVVICGKLEEFTGSNNFRGLAMTNPVFEVITPTKSTGMIGVYPASGKHEITTWQFYDAAVEATARLNGIADPVPDSLLALRGLPGRTDAFRYVHDPLSPAEAKSGRDRLAYDELLRLQLALMTARAAQSHERGIEHASSDHLGSQLVNSLGWELTEAQSRCVVEILADMRSTHSMHRLLQGDVGSGKTIVLLMALLTAVESGHQGALIVPTEILAEQHYGEIASSLEGIAKADGSPIRVALLTHKVTGKPKILKAIAAGEVDIAVGTHALLAKNVSFASLSAVVVDEQHRFGVDQRRALREKGSNGRLPDTLYASATPIPRTAVLTVFGDLDNSVIDQMPPGRTPVHTVHESVANADLTNPESHVWDAVRREVMAGRQAFVVCPLVTASATKEAAAAEATAANLSLGALHGLKIGVVTGKQKADERKKVMASFEAGELDVLVATTVIEVGVNVPNATAMVVLGADKFGLAQLHQLRGRVGRGQWPGVCYLVSDLRTSAATERIKAMVDTSDGFVLAERDLAIRGAGQVLGSAQSGAARDLRVADLMADHDLIAAAKTDAALLLADDPHLTRRPQLRAEITRAVGAEAEGWLLSA